MSKSVNSNCSVSHVILYPEQEVASFNGFAWSNLQGMIHQTSNNAPVTLDITKLLGNQK